MKSSSSPDDIKNILDIYGPIKLSPYLTVSELSNYCRINKKQSNPENFFRALFVPATFKDPEEFLSAWTVFNTTMKQAHIKGHAVLYKMRDKTKLRVKITDQLQSKGFGQVYMPTKIGEKDFHTWYGNLAWVYAQAQVQRPFSILSPFYNDNIYRDKPLKRGEYKPSAFLCEIAAALKIGYQAEIHFEEKEDKPYSIYLSPPIDTKKIRQLKILDLNPSEQDIKLAIETIKPLQKEKDELIPDVKKTLFYALQHESLFAAILEKQYPVSTAKDPIKEAEANKKGVEAYQKQSEGFFQKIVTDQETKLCLFNNEHIFKTVYNDLIAFIKKFGFSATLEEQIIKEVDVRYQKIVEIVKEYATSQVSLTRKKTSGTSLPFFSNKKELAPSPNLLSSTKHSLPFS